jgi:hypothetical protein
MLIQDYFGIPKENRTGAPIFNNKRRSKPHPQTVELHEEQDIRSGSAAAISFEHTNNA